MPFDLASAEPIKGGFDLSSAKPANGIPDPAPAGAPIDPRIKAVEQMKARPFGSGASSMAYDVGGKITDVAAKYLPPEVAAGLGYAGNVATEAIPALFGAGAGGKVGEAITPAAERAAKTLMQSALKPDKAARTSGKAADAIQTMLETGTLASKGGAEKLGDKADLLGQEVRAALANSNGTVSKGTVANYLMPIYEKYLKQSNPTKDLKAIGEEAKEFVDHVLLKAYGDKIPVQLAQEIKQGNYRALGDKSYGMGLKPEAERDAKKALTMGLKEGIEQVAPEVKDLNASQSSLFNAKKIIESALSSSGNKNPVGIGMVAPTMEKTLAWLMDRSPWLKSVMAQALHTAPNEVGFKGLGQMGGAAAGGALGASAGQPPTARDMVAPPSGIVSP